MNKMRGSLLLEIEDKLILLAHNRKSEESELKTCKMIMIYLVYFTGRNLKECMLCWYNYTNYN